MTNLRVVCKTKFTFGVLRNYCTPTGLQLGLPNKFFITTPIYYLNSAPHIGHLYTNVLADVANRWHSCVLAVPTQFSTGTDEHGLKVFKAASLCNEPVEQFCSKLSNRFKDLSDLADVGYTNFIRTTDEAHRRTVQDVWTKLRDKGFVKEGSYEGWYSVSDEAFVGADQVADAEVDGVNKKVFVESGNVVEWVKEDNYVFQLSKFAGPLLEWLESKVIQPELYVQPLRFWIESGLPDLSVSRDGSKNPWGVPVPGHPSQIVYVWLDALVNYLTASRYPSQDCTWPVDCHVIGKDIIKFHAVYWPAFLMALGLELPKKIICHSHWQINREKMSKSKGNVVDPFEKMDAYGADGLRYYLMKDGSIHGDSNYSDERAVECINSDLVNTLSNLLSRSTGNSINPEQIFPSLDEGVLNSLLSAEERTTGLYDLVDRVDVHYRNFAINKALEAIMSELYAANALFQKYKPWSLPKNEAMCIIYLSLETVRIASLALQPVVPQLADKALNRLGIPKHERTWKSMKFPNNRSGSKLGDNCGPLLQRLVTKRP